MVMRAAHHKTPRTPRTLNLEEPFRPITLARLDCVVTSFQCVAAMTPPDDPNRRIPVGNSQMTRQETLAALEDYMTFAKDSAEIGRASSRADEKRAVASA